MSVIWTLLWVRAAIDTRKIFQSDPEARPDLAFVVVVFLNNATGSVLALTASLSIFADIVEALYLGLVLCPLFTASALLWNVVRSLSGLRTESPAAVREVESDVE